MSDVSETECEAQDTNSTVKISDNFTVMVILPLRKNQPKVVLRTQTTELATVIQGKLPAVTG